MPKKIFRRIRVFCVSDELDKNDSYLRVFDERNVENVYQIHFNHFSKNALNKSKHKLRNRYQNEMFRKVPNLNFACMIFTLVLYAFMILSLAKLKIPILRQCVEN